MPCICHGAVSGDEFLDSIIKTPEYATINDLLKEAARIANTVRVDAECYYDEYQDSWVKAFSHHIKGCNGK